ncbi:MAG TPA: hypothetical protein VGB75_08620 [Jatrophihabitans sp.]|uniref:hypothetical protein n=1 Tax=Jatrophihabitans sp. TaxID=1932789 RepID=UPI002EE264E6
MSQHAPAVLAASDTGKGSPIGLFVVLVLVIAVYLLYRSMSGHLRRLPERFPGYGAAGTDGAGADGVSTAAAAGGVAPADPDADDPDTAARLGGDPVRLAKQPPAGPPAGPRSEPPAER